MAKFPDTRDPDRNSTFSKLPIPCCVWNAAVHYGPVIPNPGGMTLRKLGFPLDLY